jgi:hypothetical protein
MTPPTVFDAAPRSVRVYQIEVTNHCNATCTYCPQPTHARPRGFIELATMHAILRAMSNTEVELHHFGEPLLHKRLEDIVSLCVAHGVAPGISTNGRTLTQDRVDSLARAGLAWLRIHTDPFGVRLSQFKTPVGLEATEHRLLVKSDAPRKELQDFAGHLDLVAPNLVRKGRDRCSYLRDDWRVVLWDGRWARCCNDVEGVNDDSLCGGCDGYVFATPRTVGDYDGLTIGSST